MLYQCCKIGDTREMYYAKKINIKGYMDGSEDTGSN